MNVFRTRRPTQKRPRFVDCLQLQDLEQLKRYIRILDLSRFA